MAILPLRNNGCPAVGVGKNSDSLIAGSFSVQVLCVGSALECVRKNVIVILVLKIKTVAPDINMMSGATMVKALVEWAFMGGCPS